MRLDLILLADHSADCSLHKKGRTFALRIDERLSPDDSHVDADAEVIVPRHVVFAGAPTPTKTASFVSRNAGQVACANDFS